MKKILFLLLSLPLLLSCSNDDAKPDSTAEFVGKWKSEIEDNGLYFSSETWIIDKTGDARVRISSEFLIMSKDEKVIPSSKTQDVLQNVEITNDGTMVIDYETIIDKVTYQVKGTGIIKNGKLSVAGTQKSLKDGTSDSVFFEMDKVGK